MVFLVFYSHFTRQNAKERSASEIDRARARESAKTYVKGSYNVNQKTKTEN